MDYLQYDIDRLSGNKDDKGFKPYYKWITFNTNINPISAASLTFNVLNLIINGLPSIR